MPKATLMVRFRRSSDPDWIRRPAVYGSTGRVQPGVAEFKDRVTRRQWVEDIGKNYSYDIRVEDGRTTYEPAGRNGADAEALRLRIMAKFAARAQCEAAGLVVIDPAQEEKKRPRLKDTFDDYIEDALKRGALEAREQAILVKAEFLHFVPIVYVDEVNRDRILSFDAALREHGSSGRTLFNKRQRLQSMLRWSGVDPKIFPPKPKYEKKLPTIYTPDQLAGLFRVATPYERTVCNLALKLGLRDQEVRFAECTDISWHESVFRVRSKPQYGFTVKDYEQRDIPIPLDLLDELRARKEAHPGQNLIVPTPKGKPNDKLLRMVKGTCRVQQGYTLNSAILPGPIPSKHNVEPTRRPHGRRQRPGVIFKMDELFVTNPRRGRPCGRVPLIAVVTTRAGAMKRSTGSVFVCHPPTSPYFRAPFSRQS